MKNTYLSTGLAKLKQAEPLPTLFLGYLWGLLFGWIHFGSMSAPLAWTLSFPSVGEAFLSTAIAELPFWSICTALGFCRIPRLSLLPLLFRSFLWGYGSFLVYLSAGKSSLYFLYVWGSALILLPLACLTKFALLYSTSAKRQTGRDHLRYLYQCLYFWGLTIIFILFRGMANQFIC